MMTPAQRSMRARLASHTSWSNTADRRARTEPATRAGSWDRFEKAIRAEAAERGESLTDEQLRSMVESRRSAYFTRLSMQAAAARRKKAPRPKSGESKPEAA
ncbi:hypothetical protein [Embleya sp. AB8]|uniref:hypothetical protein n=1 Tax=Embleya sp. AB8 TaxID=3156304 RepID=UPI003C70B426